MIYVDMKGNLGNQLFEYACARQIQEITGQTICLNSYFLKKYRPQFTFNLPDFMLNENIIFDEDNPLPWYANTYEGVVRVAKKIFPKTLFSLMKIWGCFVWMESVNVELPILPIKKNYYVVGYWQSTIYFSKVDKILIDEFVPKYPFIKENENLYNLIEKTESVCVTIRRGDYVNNDKIKKQFFVCDETYFTKCAKNIKKSIPNAVFFIFSDDIEWAKENLELDGEVYYESGNDTVWEKLRLMSACKHFILSNSSFSWWAQHLSKNPGKIVYAPSKWFKDDRKCGIYEEGWKCVEVE